MAQVCLLLGALGFIILYIIVVVTVMNAFNEWQHRKIIKHYDAILRTTVAIKNATTQLAETRKQIEDLKQEDQNNE